MNWASTFNVSNNAVTNLLHLIHDRYPELLLSSATLLQAKSTKNITELGRGRYTYFGIAGHLTKALKSRDIAPCRNQSQKYSRLIHDAAQLNRVLISLQIFIDGFTVYKSSSESAWIILGYVNETESIPFVIGCYYGVSKPTDMDAYLNPPVSKLNQLQIDGLRISGTHYHVALYGFVCDAMARAMIKKCKTCTGYFGCDFCKIPGQYSPEHRKVIYPTIDCVKRNDNDFRNDYEDSHILGKSSLTQLTNIGMVSDFVPEPMHCLYIGVCKRLIKYWTGNILRPSERSRLSGDILESASCLPSEFKRKIRSLNDIDRWKATEFRNFLLYVGPLVIHRFLPKALVDHFYLLHFSTYIMSLSNYEDFLNEASRSLDLFVTQVEYLYSQSMLVYNIHILSHISTYVRSHGPLDGWSAFKFESFLHRVKARLRSPKLVLEQLCNRIDELNSLPTKSLPFKFRCRLKDSVFVTPNGIIFASSFEDGHVTGKRGLLVQSLYKSPIDSKHLYIGYYRISETTFSSTISKKCVVFPTNDYFLVIPCISNT